MDITELLGSSNLKKLHFLELLNTNSSEWISKEELAFKLNISINGLLLLYDSVHLSNSQLMSKIEIELSGSLGFRLTKAISSFLDEIRLELLKSEISFNLLLDSFNNSYGSKNNFLERMFISRATFYREISKLKNFLMKFGLSFNSKSGKVIGELAKLRKFYFNFFWETYKIFEWPFKKIYFKDTQSAVEFFEKNSNIELDIVTKRKFMYLLAVVFNDVNQELFMNEKMTMQVNENSIFKSIILLFRRKYYLLNEKKIEKEILYVYQFFLCSLASNKEEIIIDIAIEYFKVNETEQFEFSKELLNSIEVEFPSIFKNTKEKKSVLFSGIQLIVELKTFGEVYFSKNKNIVLNYNHEFKFKLEKILVNMIGNFNFFYINQDSFDFIVMMITNYFYFSADLKSTMNEYNIMIISESYDHEHYIKSKLNELVPMKLRIVDNAQMDKNIDLIITDMKCENFYPDIPSFSIVDIFSSKDWIKLREVILRYNSKKKFKRSSQYAD